MVQAPFFPGLEPFRAATGLREVLSADRSGDAAGRPRESAGEIGLAPRQLVELSKVKDQAVVKSCLQRQFHKHI